MWYSFALALSSCLFGSCTVFVRSHTTTPPPKKSDITLALVILEEYKNGINFHQRIYDLKSEHYNVTDDFGRTLLHYVVMRGFENDNKELVIGLTENGADVNAQDENGFTPLHIAVRKGVRDLVDYLISRHKADPNIPDAMGRTPIFIALENDDSEMAKILIGKGADMNHLDKKGRSLLHICAATGKTQFAEVLIRSGADTSIKNDEMMTPIQTVYIAYIEGGEAGEEKFKELLIQYRGLPNFNDTEEFRAAAKQGDLKVIKRLLPEKNINAADDYGNTALIYAACHGQATIVEYLLENGADPNLATDVGTRPLSCPASISVPEMMRIVDMLCEYGANASETQFEEKNALDIAIVHNSVIRDYMIDYFIQKKVVPKYVSITGRTPLHFAVMRGKMELVKYLIENGANVNAADKNGWTPLHLSVKPLLSSIDNVKAMDILIQNGANINAKDKEGRSPLQVAVIKESKTESRRQSTIEFLLKNGADMNVQDKQKNTPLHLAAMSGRSDVVTKLLKLGAKVDIEDKWGNSPLIRAVKDANNMASNETARFNVTSEQYKKVVNILIESGANVNHANSLNATALYFVAKGGIAAELLIEKEADVSIMHKIRRTPFHVAMRYNNNNISELIISKGKNVGKLLEGKLLHTAVLRSKQDGVRIAELLIKAGVDVNYADEKGRTPLYRAAYQIECDEQVSRANHEEIVAVLIKNGANVNAPNFDGNTPLHAAIRNGGERIVQILVQNGSDVNARDQFGRTPLELVEMMYWRDPAKLRKFLIDNGAKQ